MSDLSREGLSYLFLSVDLRGSARMLSHYSPRRPPRLPWLMPKHALKVINILCHSPSRCSIRLVSQCIRQPVGQEVAVQEVGDAVSSESSIVLGAVSGVGCFVAARMC